MALFEYNCKIPSMMLWTIAHIIEILPHYNYILMVGHNPKTHSGLNHSEIIFFFFLKNFCIVQSILVWNFSRKKIFDWRFFATTTKYFESPYNMLFSILKKKKIKKKIIKFETVFENWNYYGNSKIKIYPTLRMMIKKMSAAPMKKIKNFWTT